MMIQHVTSQVVLEATLAAAKDYTDIVTDHDPFDGDYIVPGELRRFLAGLRLLQGVPFSYLLPDADLLPIESIRFFYIDRAWTDALMQGVLSIGTISTADRIQLQAVYPRIRDDVDQTERTLRNPGEKTWLQGAGGTLTGFLMRSRLVSGWPNLHVRAYHRDVLPDDTVTTKAESHPDRLKVMRMERLAPAILFVLFDGVPQVVHIEEPRQGMQFGVCLNVRPDGKYEARARLRDNDNGNPVPPEDKCVEENSIPVPFRRGAPGVINIARLRDDLAIKAPNAGDALESNEYALQMLRYPYRQVFGDPDNSEGSQFYDLNQFRPTISLATWKARINPNPQADS
jgi:hypothetical protein